MAEATRRIVTKVHDELAKYQEIKAILQDEVFDEQCLLDTLEGETYLHEALCAVGEQIAENNILVDGIDAQMERLSSRKSRVKRTNESLREIITRAMDNAGLKTVVGPLFTLSVRKIAPGLGPLDEAEVPARFFTQPKPVLDKKAILAALNKGEHVPGARLTNGGIGLTIRVK